jgi:putative membrane protein
MLRLLAQWVLNAVSLLIVTRVVPGFQIHGGFRVALIAALVIGLVNVTLGALLKLLTFPLAFVTFGLFFLVINAFMLEFASSFVKGFSVDGFWHAFLAAILLAVMHKLWDALLSDKRKREAS